MALFVELHACRTYALVYLKGKLSISQIETVIQLKETFYLLNFSISVNCTLKLIVQSLILLTVVLPTSYWLPNFTYISFNNY